MSKVWKQISACNVKSSWRSRWLWASAYASDSNFFRLDAPRVSLLTALIQRGEFNIRQTSNYERSRLKLSPGSSRLLPWKTNTSSPTQKRHQVSWDTLLPLPDGGIFQAGPAEKNLLRQPLCNRWRAYPCFHEKGFDVWQHFPKSIRKSLFPEF